jgi:23S rRNA pseudouridine2605 synthase
LTAEQLEASRAERMRQNGHGARTLEDARTWIEETGLCLFLPKRQFSSSIAPSFVEAVAGRQDATPDPKHVTLAEELLVRLETDGVAVRLNLLGQPGEQPDFVVAAWVLPYVYALRGDRDWRRNPQLTGSRQVSQLAVQAYKQLEAGDATISTLTRALGREVNEAAVLRAITELWQQLRIIPVVAAPGQRAKWQLLRTRFQKAIAEGASTSQVTAISVLASIYLQAVIAASMEEVEMFLAPLTSRSKVREVLRGLVATRQVHNISLGHAPQFYVAGTLPEFADPQTIYASSSMPASGYFLRTRDYEDDAPEFFAPKPSVPAQAATPLAPAPAASFLDSKPAEAPLHRTVPGRKPSAAGKKIAPRPHFSRPAAHSRDRKPSQSSNGGHAAGRSSVRPGRRAGSEVRPSATRPASGLRWNSSGAKSTNGKHSANGNGNQNGNGKHNGVQATNGSKNGLHSNGVKSNGVHANGSAKRPGNGTSGTRSAKAPAWNKQNRAKQNGHGNGSKAAGKPGASSRGGNLQRGGVSVPRKSGSARPTSALRRDVRTDARASRSARKPALTAGAKSGSGKRFGFAARPKPHSKQATKKRG